MAGPNEVVNPKHSGDDELMTDAELIPFAMLIQSPEMMTTPIPDLAIETLPDATSPAGVELPSTPVVIPLPSDAVVSDLQTMSLLTDQHSLRAIVSALAASAGTDEDGATSETPVTDAPTESLDQASAPNPSSAPSEDGTGSSPAAQIVKGHLEQPNSDTWAKPAAVNIPPDLSANTTGTPSFAADVDTDVDVNVAAGDSFESAGPVDSESLPTPIVEPTTSLSGGSASATTTPVATATPANITHQIVSAVSTQLVNLNDGDVLMLDAVLDPPELGRLHFRLTKSKSGVKAVVTAENGEVQQVIANHVHAIEQSLRSQWTSEAPLQFVAGDALSNDAPWSHDNPARSDHAPSPFSSVADGGERTDSSPEVVRSRAEVDILA